MDVDTKFINNIISYFSETNLTDRFKSAFLEELETDAPFQKKVEVLLDSDGAAPSDEIMWKKIIDFDEKILPDEMQEKLFFRFKDILHDILKTQNSS